MPAAVAACRAVNERCNLSTHPAKYVVHRRRRHRFQVSSESQILIDALQGQLMDGRCVGNEDCIQSAVPS